ncbi:hypothetical protein [Microbulbifer sp. GL-2]|uniref:hypothetical protein n=1 Tax=Microbulbifer sp. GL-2 TaxID=2591606 RepID=UPI001162D588|nr:hypothetical protein [Microbulbifer sp. GL-2]BBM02168.1 hypothetical protein GL2_22420 [Microbulbifer sp. GL-2]
MARKKNSGPGRRQRTLLRSGFMDRHRLRMRQLQARRARLRNSLSGPADEDGGDWGSVQEEPASAETEGDSY